MKRFFAAIVSVAVLGALPAAGFAQGACPPEVGQAKQMLSQKMSMAKSQGVQAPRSLAGARQNVQQAPRGQDV
ncbi:MAG: hypothetical protein ACREJG_14410, partial [Candidatus Rokuibacteriota bacterium]